MSDLAVLQTPVKCKIIKTGLASCLAAGHAITVTGDGVDEWMGGYPVDCYDY